MPRVIEGPADWRGPDLAHSRAWIHEMSTAEAAEIGAALDIARRRGRTFESLIAEVEAQMGKS